MRIEEVNNNFQYARCVTIRYEVFIRELGGTYDINFDERENEGINFLCWMDEKPVGTLRTRIFEGRSAKIEQLAVLEPYRKFGIGRALMEHVGTEMKRHAVKEITVNAQEQASKFYLMLGYKIVGEKYMIGKFPHYKMSIVLN